MCPFYLPYEDANLKIVAENAHGLFVSLPHPVLQGSGIIIPRQHRETVFDFSDDEWTATFALLKQAKRMLDADYHPQGYNVGWNNGAVAGQTVSHVHLPRDPALRRRAACRKRHPIRDQAARE